MKARHFSIPAIVAILLAAPVALYAQAPAGTAFTYQGQLKLAGVRVDDDADFEFTLWDDPNTPPGTQVGPLVPVDNVQVVKGLFTVKLDFGNVFTGDARWLEIAVRSPHDPTDTLPFTTLSPRQELTPVPYAQQIPGIFVNDDGNVGIGTDSPATPLHVIQPVGPGTGVVVEGEANVAPNIKLLEEEGEWAAIVLRPIHGDALQFRTGGAGDAVTIQQDGDVGIGTTSPSYPLDVNGNIGVNGHLYGTHANGLTVATTVGDLTLGPTTSKKVNIGWDGSHRDLYVSGDVGIGTTSPACPLHVVEPAGVGAALMLEGEVDGVTPNIYFIEAGSATANIRLSEANSNALELQTAEVTRLTIQQDGDVGIGTTSPDRKLHVVTDTVTAGRFECASYSGVVTLAVGDAGIVAGGNTYGGWFSDLNSSGEGTVGCDTYKVVGTGSVNFVQNHPQDPEKVIVYAAPEGDEVATYTRGTGRLVDGVARVPLGETFKWVTNPGIGLTAYLTPRGRAVPLAVVSLTTEELVVRGPENGPQDVLFDYLVYGLRIGFEEVSVVQEKEREAYIPSMASHRERYEKHPELRHYNALERFKAMRAAVGESGPLDLSASHALRDAIIEFDPAVHELPRPDVPGTEDLEDGESPVDTDTDYYSSRPEWDTEAPPVQTPNWHETAREADGVIQAQHEEIAALRARLEALETLVAELTAAEDGGAK